MKNFLWYILVLLSFLNSSAQQANLNDNFALKLSETRNVDEHFIMSEDKFGVFHLDSIKKYSRVYINLERYDEALVYTNVLSNFYIYKTLQHKEAFKTLNNFEKHLTNVTIPSEIGNLVAFKVTANCWHGFKAYEGKRLSIQLNYVNPQSASSHRFRHTISSKIKQILKRT